MSHVSIKQYPQLAFTSEFLEDLALCTSQARARVLDLLDRINKYGLDKMMVGTCLEGMSGNNSVTLRIHCDSDILLILLGGERNGKNIVNSLKKVSSSQVS
ncbi:hypothetical protein FZC78_22635 [Rossellomorea vietnamensis]|uniref:Uncharacterized protein n=1 Tax=Rossellomorea vietnamensis TaxID=218284 RepID=A0A5D4NGZ1_9BACI|nr:hypothetical protein [Rossellomorea vietnamensis]TYS12984.1 hypothetical protein FZC78_22635 [Rossellomorea vietnamensis]